MSRSYRYVGPERVREESIGSTGGSRITSLHDLAQWIASNRDEESGGVVAATFTVGLDEVLRVAARRSEHIACASGEDVLSAGEIFFSARGPARVLEVTNLSTGFCPEPSSWHAVAASLAKAQIEAPEHFTTDFVFRRCPDCRQRNVVKEDFFFCAICGAELPAFWNFDP